MSLPFFTELKYLDMMKTINDVIEKQIKTNQETRSYCKDCNKEYIGALILCEKCGKEFTEYDRRVYIRGTDKFYALKK